MNEFGIDLSELNIKMDQYIPAAHPGRIASIDADGLCYLAAAVTEDQSFAACKEAFDNQVRSRTAMCAAVGARLHLTGNDKGGRYATALVKEYQASRKGKAKPKHLDTLRSWVQSRYVHGDYLCIMNENQEADDGMAQDNYAAYASYTSGVPELSIIHSLDKDLTMCSGYHCDWNTYEIVHVEGYGSCYLDESGSTKKVKGYGTSFFWHQLLMGDTADCIPGLPTVKGPQTLKLASAAVLKAKECLATYCDSKGKPLTADKVDKQLRIVEEFQHKGKPCGAVAAYRLLEDCKTDMEALHRVVGLYRECYGRGAFDFTDWRSNQHRLTAGDMVVEQARLLWMRRTVDECPTTFMAQVLAGEKWYE